MIRKVKESIGLKTFLSMMALLVSCCVIIYGLVLYFLPKNYQVELESQFTTEFKALVETHQTSSLEGNSNTIVAFSIKNNASVKVVDDAGSQVFSINTAGTEEKTATNKSLGATAQFQYQNETYTMNATASFAAVAQSYNVLIKLLPLIAVMIILIAGIGAYICSRSFSKPLVKISDIAIKMKNLDMTWKCDSSRSDEIGILASSLNEMSSKLSDALNNLQSANEQLQIDIENKRCQEKQRIEFFTSVSHELKTPLTVIKGEFEGMIYQVGDYKDRDTYLRHSLKTAIDMEKLVEEILAAVKMGGSDFELSISDLLIDELIQICCHKIDGLAEDKEIHMTIDLEKDF